MPYPSLWANGKRTKHARLKTRCGCTRIVLVTPEDVIRQELLVPLTQEPDVMFVDPPELQRAPGVDARVFYYWGLAADDVLEFRER